MNMMKKLAVAAVVACGAAGTGASFVPGVASAAPARYNGACGSGYRVIASFNVHGKDSGTVYYVWNPNHWSCVVTIRDHPGTRLYMDASLRVSGGTWYTDRGNYTTYAGPVRVYTKGKCIDWGGGIGPNVAYRYHEYC